MNETFRTFCGRLSLATSEALARARQSVLALVQKGVDCLLQHLRRWHVLDSLFALVLKGSTVSFDWWPKKDEPAPSPQHRS